jgi:hypothetical protein
MAAARHQRASSVHVAPEQQLLAAAVRQIVLPALSQQDVPAFEDMLAQALPEAAAAADDFDPAFLLARQERDVAAALMHKALLGAFSRQGLRPSEAWLGKVQELQLALEAGASGGVLLLGPPCSGKSCTVQLLGAAVREMAANGASGVPAAVRVSELHPEAWGPEQLLGRSTADGGWEDGLLAAAVRAAAQEVPPAAGSSGQQQPSQHWLVLRGGLQGDWLRHVQPLLAPVGRHLQLPSGEVLPAPSNLRVVVEATAAAGHPALDMDAVPAAEPTTAQALEACSAVATICFHPELLGWQALLQSWAQCLPAQQLLPSAEHRQQLQELCSLLLPHCLDAAAMVSGKGQPGAPEALLSRRVLQLLEALLRGGAAAPASSLLQLQPVQPKAVLQPAQQPVQTLLAGRPAAEQQALLQAAVLTALAWGLGAHLPEALRQQMDAGLRGVLAAAAAGELQPHSGSAGGGPSSYLATPEPVAAPSEGAADETSEPLKLLVPLPAGRPIFDLVFDPSAMKWVAWSDLLAQCQQEQGVKAGSGPGAVEQTPELLVPTPEQLRCAWLVQLLQQAGVPVALLGPAGAGKSALLRHLLRRQQQSTPAAACYSHSSFMGGSEGLAHTVAARRGAQVLQLGSGQPQRLDLLVDGLVQGEQVRRGRAVCLSLTCDCS